MSAQDGERLLEIVAIAVVEGEEDRTCPDVATLP